MIEAIRNLSAAGSLRWTQHCTTRLFQRGISSDDVRNVLRQGSIIEEYPDDYPYPSCLLLGFSATTTPLHVVCGVAEQELWIVTAYRPDPAQWADGFASRKEGV